MATKKFSISMPADAYDHYQQKAQAAGMSISQFLFRAGSITTVEQAVMFPLQNNNQDSMGVPTQNTQVPYVQESQGKTIETKSK